MYNMDTYVFNKSLSSAESHDFIVENKTWVDIPDSNGASYTSNKVTWNLDNISSGSDYFNAKETILTIPLNLAIECNRLTGTANQQLLADPTIIENYFAASLKAGAWHLIDKINYRLNANEVITLDNFENIKMNFKVLTSWSQDDVAKRGDELHFAKDTALSSGYSALWGATNSTLIDQAFSPAYGFGVGANKGRVERLKRTSIGSVTSALLNTADMADKYQDYCSVTTNSTTSATINYFILCSFRLGDLHPFFEAMPLCKNPSQYLSLTLNTNAVQTITYSATAANVVTLSASVSGSTNSCPYQLSPISTTTSVSGLRLGVTSAVSTGYIKSCINVKQATLITGSAPHRLSQAQFRACFVKLSPSYNIEYAKSPVKAVCWEECYAQFGGAFSNVAVGASLNSLISGSFSKLRRIVICPFLSASANAGNSPLISTFAAEPATCSAYVGNGAVSNMNIRLGIQNVYPQNVLYTYQNYLEFQATNSLNGGIQAGMSSGLITQMDWETCYGYRVIDLTHHSELDDKTPQSISVILTNSSTQVMDYVILVYYEKAMGLDCERGLIVV